MQNLFIYDHVAYRGELALRALAGVTAARAQHHTLRGTVPKFIYEVEGLPDRPGGPAFLDDVVQLAKLRRRYPNTKVRVVPVLGTTTDRRPHTA